MRHTLTLMLMLACTSMLFAQAGGGKPNIILIISDDLNDYIGVFGGQPQVETPNIDSLAKRGMIFTNAFCNSPVCGPSRTSFLSGKDVLYTQVFENLSYEDVFRNNFTAAKGNEEVITLPEHLKNNGYFTFTINKVIHNYYSGDEDNTTSDPCLKEKSWSRVSRFKDFGWLNAQMNSACDGVNLFQFGDIEDDLEDNMMDYRAVDTAIKFINDVSAGTINTCDNPFFMAVGLARPHLDLLIPEHYFFDDYIKDFHAADFNIPFNEPNNAWPPNGLVMPPQPEVLWGDYERLGIVGKNMATQNNPERQFIHWGDTIEPRPYISGELSEEDELNILQESIRANGIMAYIAAIQFMDAQVGRLMDALDAQPEVAENTIIIFISDNGFSLGEKKHWAKSSLWETDIRVPLIIVDPNKPGNKICTRTVGLLDLYPTICEIASIDKPTFADSSEYLDGLSIVPLINQPQKKWERPVISTVKLVHNLQGSCFPQYSIRSERFHYIKYASNNDGTIDSNICDEPSSKLEEELYEIGANRETDPNEWNNLAANPDYIPVKNYLSQFLPDGALYLKQAHTVSITNGVIPCFLTNTGKLNLQAKLYYPDGTLVPNGLLSNYQFKWTNNLKGAEFYGVNFPFLLAAIPSNLYLTRSKILFYVTVTELATGNIVAFDTKTFSLNPVNTPSSDFEITMVDNTATVGNYTISGTYNNIKWDFGDGFSTTDLIPGPHTYATPGNYTITNYVYYGNTCSSAFSKYIHINELKKTDYTGTNLVVFPNPANDILTVNFGRSLTDITIMVFNSMGQAVYVTNGSGDSQQAQLNIKHLSAGTYIVKIQSKEYTTNRIFEIVR